MALHRDIYWVGRQWAVTGFGVQAVDQRLKGAFDVEAARLWEDGLPQRMRALAWLKADDFNKALEIARSRFPEPPRKAALPLVESVLELIQPSTHEPAKPAAALMETTLPQSEPARIELLPQPKMLLPEAPQPEARPPVLALRIEHASAKFLPRWRVRS